MTTQFFAVPTAAALATVYDTFSGEGSTGFQQTAYAADDLFLKSAAGQADDWCAGRSARMSAIAGGLPGAGLAASTPTYGWSGVTISMPTAMVTPTFEALPDAGSFPIYGASAARDMAVIDAHADWDIARMISAFASIGGQYGGTDYYTDANLGMRVRW